MNGEWMVENREWGIGDTEIGIGTGELIQILNLQYSMFKILSTQNSKLKTPHFPPTALVQVIFKKAAVYFTGIEFNFTAGL